MNFVSRMWNDERGQDLIEYALMAGFVAVAAAGIFTGVGGKLETVFNKVKDTLDSSIT